MPEAMTPEVAAMAARKEKAGDQRKPKKVVARGKGIVRSDAEIDEMTSAEAMMALAEEAAEDFRENAPRGFETLLDGEVKG